MADEQPTAIALDQLQHDLLIPQIEAFLQATADPAAREVYLKLKAAVESMEVPEELSGRLGVIVEVALQSGRIRRLFGPGGDLALAALFKKTPRGREIAASINAANAALGQIQGQMLEIVSVAMRSPGVYTLTLKTAAGQLVIRFEQSGVCVESLEVG